MSRSSPSRMRGVLTPVLVVVLALLASGPARAEFTHATLLSGTSEQQFQQAGAPAMSKSGEYVAFQGTLAGISGVWRRDLRTGTIEQVAGGDAGAPSISAEGRYVAFTSSEDLVAWRELPGGAHEGEPPSDRGCPEVYVRDMEPDSDASELATQREPEYILASALNNSREGITFGTAGLGQSCRESRLTVAGAQAAPAVALDGEGEKVVFTLDSESNLAGPGTAPGQVAVRDLKTDTTTLVTTTPEGRPAADGGRPVEGGGAFPDAYALSELTETSIGPEVGYGYDDQPAGSSAAISADGEAVAWMGMNVAAQVSAAEAAREPSLASVRAESEAEPLWHELGGSGGAGGGTRRLLTGAGLEFFTANPVPKPNMIESGSLIGTTHGAFVPPALSENGDTVAVIATAPSQLAIPSLDERVSGVSEFDSDAYVVHIEGDASTPPQVMPLTRISSYAAQTVALGSARDVAISPDGSRVAFDCARTPLESPSLALISPPSAESVDEVYVANLEHDTLQRASFAYDEAEVNGSMELLSFAGDDRALTFGSRATNLFFGDGVNAPEVYETEEPPSSAQAVPPQIDQPPALTLPASEWVLSATAAPQPDGSVIVYAQVPAAGRLQVEARAQLPAKPQGHATAKKAGKRKRPRVRSKAASAEHLVARTLGHGALAVNAAGEAELRVRASSAYRSLLDAPSGIYAILRVTFAVAGHPTLVQEIPVTLHDRTARAHTASRKRRRSRQSEKKVYGKAGARG